jgi:protein-S-isoprenylcysteine O-methyltransferase Ste14
MPPILILTALIAFFSFVFWSLATGRNQSMRFKLPSSSTHKGKLMRSLYYLSGMISFVVAVLLFSNIRNPSGEHQSILYSVLFIIGLGIAVYAISVIRHNKDQ